MITAQQARAMCNSNSGYFNDFLLKLNNQITLKAGMGLGCLTTDSIPDGDVKMKIIEHLMSPPLSFQVEYEDKKPFFTIKW